MNTTQGEHTVQGPATGTKKTEGLPPLQELAWLLDGVLLNTIDPRHSDVCLSCQQRLHGMPVLMKYRDNIPVQRHSTMK